MKTRGTSIPEAGLACAKALWWGGAGAPCGIKAGQCGWCVMSEGALGRLMVDCGPCDRVVGPGAPWALTRGRGLMGGMGCTENVTLCAFVPFIHKHLLGA